MSTAPKPRRAMEAAGPGVAMEGLWKATHPPARLPQPSHSHLEIAQPRFPQRLGKRYGSLRVSHSSHSPGDGWGMVTTTE